MMTATAQLITVSDAYCAAVKRSRSRVSTIIFNEGKKLDLVAGGADLTTRSFEKAMTWFSTNWPSQTPWPDGVRRPEPIEAQP